MGLIENITATSFPRQDVAYFGKPVDVCFHYNTKATLRGVFVRCDAESPGKAIIKLEDGRYVLTTECQWSPVREG